VVRDLEDGQGDPMAHEPRRSTWTLDAVHSLLAGAGLRVGDDIELLRLTAGLAVPTRQLRTSRVAVAVTPGT
jgi:hypothetical protein